MWHQQREAHVEWASKVLASHNDNDALEGLTPGARLASEMVRLRTYAKVKPDGHRETWRETVIRWSAYMRYRMHKQISETATSRRAALHLVAFDIQHAMATEAVFLRHVMPSMRALWAAGDVLDRSDIAAYNCYFSVCDTPVVFAEALYILMHGTGVGFSVESEFVDAMPIPAPPSSEDLSASMHVIEDSTEGWMRAVYDGVAAWYSGANVTFDYTMIRPKGAKLLTKGGEASGPEPLRKYLDALRATIQQAGREGRRLTTLECHTLLCTAGSIVQVGGVRRSAMISFSDRDDDKLRWAKFYPNGDVPEEFSQANNSWVVQTGLTREQFMAEWDILHRSGAGERGIFSPARFDYRGRLIRANPCVTGDTIVQTQNGPRRVRDLIGSPFVAIVDGQGHRSTNDGFWQTHASAPVFRLETVEGFCVRLTANHVMFRATGKPGEYEEVEAGDLRAGDKIRLSDNRRGHHVSSDTFEGVDHQSEDFATGWLLGSLFGDGTFSTDGSTPASAVLCYWGEHAKIMADHAYALMDRAGIARRSDLAPRWSEATKSWRITSRGLAERAKAHGVVPGGKVITDALELANHRVVAGFLRGMFDADGCVLNNIKKGISVRLSQVDAPTLFAVQRMLARFGVISKVHLNRTPAGARTLPDGRGGTAEYPCKALHELIISKENVNRFESLIGFAEPAKTEKLRNVLASFRRAPNKESFAARVRALVPDGEEPVYDCTIPGVHAFDANGFYVHNCVEIGLASELANGTWDGGGGQFCNLTSVVLRPSDDEDTAFRKVNLATFIGTMQACLTNFPLLREGTIRLTREDALLGVGLSNQVECPKVAQNEEVLAILGFTADNVNARWARIFGIAPAAGITCGKPDGNSSVFLGTASGVHAHHAPYYIRRVQVSSQSPVCAVLRAHGVRCIPTRQAEVGLPDEEVTGWTFELPMKAPEGSLCRKDETALGTLERISLLNRSWLAHKGHNQSATINVREDEWAEVGAWVFQNIENAGGLSFFPYDDHVYYGAPYEEIDEARYNELAAELPEVDWSMLAQYETGISEGHGTFACAGGACAIV